MAYGHYYNANEIKWTRLNLNNDRYPVKGPTEERINMVISSSTPRYSTMFHLSKHGLIQYRFHPLIFYIFNQML